MNISDDRLDDGNKIFFSVQIEEQRSRNQTKRSNQKLSQESK
jgi:hypothetical protein